MISQLLKTAGWKTGACNCSPGLPESLSPPPLHTCGCAHPPSIPFRVQMAASACSWDKRPPCTPPVKQGIRLIDMQAALLLQSRRGSFAVERAGRQLAGATVWRPYVHSTLTSFTPLMSLERIKLDINLTCNNVLCVGNRPWTGE